mgnify:CR=1 FL=1
MQTNKYFLFFVWAYGILAFLLLIPLVKQFFYLKSEISSTEVENPKELKNPNFADLKGNEFCDFFLGNSFDKFKNISFIVKLFTSNANNRYINITHKTKRCIDFTNCTKVSNNALFFNSSSRSSPSQVSFL